VWGFPCTTCVNNSKWLFSEFNPFCRPTPSPSAQKKTLLPTAPNPLSHLGKDSRLPPRSQFAPTRICDRTQQCDPLPNPESIWSCRLAFAGLLKVAVCAKKKKSSKMWGWNNRAEKKQSRWTQTFDAPKIQQRKFTHWNIPTGHDDDQEPNPYLSEL